MNAPAVFRFAPAWAGAAIVALGGLCFGAEPPVNYDESKVPAYTLPDPLVMLDGQRVTDAATWQQKRRPELLRLFETYVYGKMPGRLEKTRFVVRHVAPDALAGQAIRKEVRVLFAGDEAGPFMDLLIYLPKAAPKPVPIFLGLNFYGNHTIHPDPGITLSQSWMRDNPAHGVVAHRATEKSRRTARSRWPV